MIKSCLKPRYALCKSIWTYPYFNFTIYSNQHQRATDIVGEKTVKYDFHINEYDKVVQAFVEKRWTKKEELRII